MSRYLNRHSLGFKLVLGWLSTVVLALLISGSLIIAYDLSDYRQRTREDLQTQADLLGQSSLAALQFDDQATATEVLNLMRLRSQIHAAAIYTANGQLFASYIASDVTPENFTLPTAPAIEGFSSNGDQLRLFRPIRNGNEIQGTVFLQAQSLQYQRLTRITAIVFSVTLLALVAALIAALQIQARLIRPILEITQLARLVVTRRDFSQRAKQTTRDEIGVLVNAFNDMLAEIGIQTAALKATNTHLENEIQERVAATEEIHRLNASLEQRVAQRTAELENANRELESFSYSVSHDLRAPLRSIDGFSQALLEDYQTQLDETGRDYLRRVRAAAQRMGGLIDDLLNLSRVGRAELDLRPLDLTAMVKAIVEELKIEFPDQAVELQVADGVHGYGDARLLQVALHNLLGNAWKYTGKQACPRVEFGTCTQNGKLSYFIKDNGAGFDPRNAGRLFGAFQRLHDARDYPGTGVGLATVQRIIHRHGGQVWADAEPGKGAVFYFTLAEQQGA